MVTDTFVVYTRAVHARAHSVHAENTRDEVLTAICSIFFCTEVRGVSI